MARRKTQRRTGKGPAANGDVRPIWFRAPVWLAAIVATALVTLIVNSIWTRVGDSNDDSTVALTTGSEDSPTTPAAGMIAPFSATTLPPPPTVRQPTDSEAHACPTRKWVQSIGGVDSDLDFSETVYLEGLSDRRARMDRVTVRVLKRRRPIRGSTVSCIGYLRSPSRHLAVDLDDPSEVRYFVPRTRKRRGPAGTTDVQTIGQKAAPFTFTLGKNEIESFTLGVKGSCWCSWVVDFHFVVGGKGYTKTADDRGEPFETSSGDRARSVRWDSRRRRWRLNRAAARQ